MNNTCVAQIHETGRGQTNSALVCHAASVSQNPEGKQRRVFLRLWFLVDGDGAQIVFL